MDAGAQKVVWSRGGHTDGIVWHPPDSFGDSNGIGSRVEYAEATIMIKSRADVKTFGSMWCPGPAILGQIMHQDTHAWRGNWIGGIIVHTMDLRVR